MAQPDHSIIFDDRLGTRSRSRHLEIVEFLTILESVRADNLTQIEAGLDAHLTPKVGLTSAALDRMFQGLL